MTAAATDNESLLQTLLFSLDPGAPAGATIHPQLGLFSWTPTRLLLPATNQVIVRVTDSGSPPLSDATSFLTFVFLAPGLSGFVSPGDNLLSLSFATLPGQRYQVEFKNLLEEPFWSPLGAPVAGDGNTAIMTDSITRSQRFYRVTVLP